MPRELERLLLHPLILIALGLWALNDHVLKATWGNVFTGKLSDVTSLIVAPILLATLSAGVGLGRTSVRALLIAWCIAMAGVMIAIKLFAPAADLYRYGLAALQWPFRCLLTLSLRPLVPVFLAMDPSDLWTLPAACVPVFLAYTSKGQSGRDRCGAGGSRFRLPRGSVWG